MKLTIHNTDKIVEVNGVPARIWEGKSEGGQDVICLITRIAVPLGSDFTQFEKELKETPVVNAQFNAFPAKFLLDDEVR